MERLRKSFSEDKIEDLKGTFSLFVTEGYGPINLTLKKPGGPRKFEERFVFFRIRKENHIIYKVISDIDTSEGKITLDEFMELLMAKLQDKENKEGI